MLDCECAEGWDVDGRNVGGLALVKAAKSIGGKDEWMEARDPLDCAAQHNTSLTSFRPSWWKIFA